MTDNNVLRLGDPARHFWLTRSVARTMGLNLSDEMHRGHLSPERYAELVTRCRKCQLASKCEVWLACQARLAEAPMAGCPNSEAFSDLARVH